MKTALAIIGAWFVLAIATAAVLALLREAATQWQARQYRRAWDGTDEGRMSETPLYDELRKPPPQRLVRQVARELDRHPPPPRLPPCLPCRAPPLCRGVACRCRRDPREERLMPNTEADEGRSEAMRAYPDTADLTDYDAAGEHEWSGYEWPEAAHGRLMRALRAAEAEVTCQGCGQRGHENACDHGKNICPECWPDKCWGCQADASDAESTW